MGWIHPPDRNKGENRNVGSLFRVFSSGGKYRPKGAPREGLISQAALGCGLPLVAPGGRLGGGDPSPAALRCSRSFRYADLLYFLLLPPTHNNGHTLSTTLVQSCT